MEKRLFAIGFVALELESARLPRLEAFPGLVRGMVVHGDIFQLDAVLEADGADPFQDRVDIFFLVVDGDHD